MCCHAEDAPPAAGGKIDEEEWLELGGASDAWRALQGPTLEGSEIILTNNGRFPVRERDSPRNLLVFVCGRPFPNRMTEPTY